jgi:hypothetical protein
VDRRVIRKDKDRSTSQDLPRTCLARQRAWCAETRGRPAASSVAELADQLELTEDERQGALRAEPAGLPIAVTHDYLSRDDARSGDDRPLRHFETGSSDARRAASALTFHMALMARVEA